MTCLPIIIKNIRLSSLGYIGQYKFLYIPIKRIDTYMTFHNMQTFRNTIDSYSDIKKIYHDKGYLILYSMTKPPYLSDPKRTCVVLGIFSPHTPPPIELITRYLTPIPHNQVVDPSRHLAWSYIRPGPHSFTHNYLPSYCSLRLPFRLLRVDIIYTANLVLFNPCLNLTNLPQCVFLYL